MLNSSSFAYLRRSMLRTLFICIALLLSPFKILSAQPSVIKWEQFTPLLTPPKDSVYVINFWATWCKPCVAELPEFTSAANEIKGPVRFFFISLDFKRDYESRLIPFLSQQKLPGDVYLLDEPDYNSWIDKADPTWQGGIPATLIVNSKGQRMFYEGDLNKEEILTFIHQLIPNK